MMFLVGHCDTRGTSCDKGLEQLERQMFEDDGKQETGRAVRCVDGMFEHLE